MQKASPFAYVHQASGKKYVIVDFGIREHDLCPVVYYRAFPGGDFSPVWNRPCSEFFDGRFVAERIPAPKTRKMRPSTGLTRPPADDQELYDSLEDDDDDDLDELLEAARGD